MTSKWVIAVLLILIGVMFLALLGRKSVRVELTIRATPDEIWSVLTDSSSYSAWNPILVAVKGDFHEGATLEVDMKSPDGSVAIVRPRVKKLVPNSEINQFGGIPGVLTFDHTWRLEAEDGRTRVIQFEEYRGIGVWFWDPAWVEEAYQQANINLRNTIESR
ncbi:MAG: SRPBCC domain-containing protein [Woeseiaceae bacterium]|nr:SRPBCC domain-containing protein [Woeseiaceae bacterium]